MKKPIAGKKRRAAATMVNREINRLRQEVQTLYVCKMALATVVANYFAAKMGNQRCQGQLDETFRMAADVLVIADPGIKTATSFCEPKEKKRACGGKPS